jgi:PAS domain S-box-containing protein
LATAHLGERLRVLNESLAAARAELEESQAVGRLGNWSFDLATGAVKWSRQMFALYDRPEAAGAPNYAEILASYTEEDARRLDAAVQECARSGTPYSLVLKARPSGSGLRYALGEGRAEKDADGKVVRLYGTCIDITAQVEHQRLLESVIESDVTGYWDWNLANDTFYLSPACKKMLGYLPSELPDVRASWQALTHAEDRRMATEHIVAHVSSGGQIPLYAELRFKHKEGHWVWILCTGRVVEWASSGRAVRMVGCHIDISKRKLAEGLLADAQARAEAASSSKSEFLANMSHEIRTPLTAILGYAELVADEEDEGLSPAQRREFVGIIRRNGEHLLTIINDILDISKIEAGKMTVEQVAMKPAQAAEEVLALIAVKAQAKGLALRAEVDGACPERIVCDPIRLRQILVNLVGNAVKFTDAGSVSLRVVPEAETGCIRFEVHDTGIGLTGEELRRVFGAFEQADAGTTRRHGGTGLGLCVSQRFAQMLGGRIEASSEKGVGSTFTFVVPIRGRQLVA